MGRGCAEQQRGCLVRAKKFLGVTSDVSWDVRRSFQILIKN
jgi:hypothetical protein